MPINNFLRFTETLKVKQEKRVVSVTVKPVLSDCTGTLYITDLQLQECGKLTGYTPHASEMLPTGERPLRLHNGVVRSSATVILFNLGETSAVLDCYIGNRVLQRLTTPSYKNHTRIIRPREEWCVFENHHEPLVSDEVFETVQKLRSVRRKFSMELML